MAIPRKRGANKWLLAFAFCLLSWQKLSSKTELSDKDGDPKKKGHQPLSNLTKNITYESGR